MEVLLAEEGACAESASVGSTTNQRPRTAQAWAAAGDHSLDTVLRLHEWAGQDVEDARLLVIGIAKVNCLQCGAEVHVKESLGQS